MLKERGISDVSLVHVRAKCEEYAQTPGSNSAGGAKKMMPEQLLFLLFFPSCEVSLEYSRCYANAAKKIQRARTEGCCK